MIVIAILAALIFIYSLLSHRLERTILTGPMIFTAAGILLYLAMPDQLAAPLEVKPVLQLMEIALAVVLEEDPHHQLAEAICQDDRATQQIRHRSTMGASSFSSRN